MMKLNLQQVSAFVAAAQCGSFSAAARSLNRAQSAISSGVSNLEVDLNVLLFDRSKREPTLTMAGQSLLPRAKQLLEQARSLQGHAEALSQNEEGKIVLAIEESFICEDVNQLFCHFDQMFPFIELELLFPVRHDVVELIAQRRADIGVLHVLFDMPQDYQIFALGEVRQSVIVSPEHPLAKSLKGSFDALRSHRQLILDSRGSGVNSFDQLSHQVWRIESQFALLGLVRNGLGWSWSPSHMIKEEVEKGVLIELKFEGGNKHFHSPVDMIIGNHYVQGNAGTWLKQAFSQLPFLRK